jgi:hypothetical protein
VMVAFLKMVFFMGGTPSKQAVMAATTCCKHAPASFLAVVCFFSDSCLLLFPS